MPRTATAKRPSPPRDYHAAPDGLAPLTADMIRRYTDPNSFNRGRGYARGGRIFKTVRRGTTLQARCHGSSGGPYRVEAILAAADDDSGHNPTAARCDCPRGGFCKHIVALLLTWIESPESFEARPPLAEMLADKSREELITLIELMLDADPDLDLVLRLPAPGSGAPSDAPVDEAALRDQIKTALDELGYDRSDEYSSYGGYPYYDEYAEYNPTATVVSESLQRLTTLGQAYLEGGQWRNALSVYATLVEQIASEMESIDEYGYAGEDERPALLSACDEGLARLLEAQHTRAEIDQLTAEERDRLIEALYTLWFTDLEFGGMDVATEGPAAIARFATPEERRKIGIWLRELIVPRSGDAWTRDVINRAAINFLTFLGPDGGLSDDELLAEFRKAELWEGAAAMLLRTHRVEEAITLAGRHLTAAMSLTHFADQLIAGDETRIEQAIALVDGCLWEREGRNLHDDHVLSMWLERQYAAHGRPEKALELARRRFQQAPSKEIYDTVMTWAHLPDRTGPAWDDLRPELLATLRKRDEWYDLVDIHLEASEAEEALAAYKQAQKHATLRYFSPDYAERVAVAVAPTLPDEAIAIYREQAEREIAERKRPAYQEAAQYLAEAKRLLVANDRGDEWSTIITDLRQQYKTLRALREELDALDLR
jgi:uncharacterized Zn finger protein